MNEPLPEVAFTLIERAGRSPVRQYECGCRWYMGWNGSELCRAHAEARRNRFPHAVYPFGGSTAYGTGWTPGLAGEYRGPPVEAMQLEPGSTYEWPA